MSALKLKLTSTTENWDWRNYPVSWNIILEQYHRWLVAESQWLSQKIAPTKPHTWELGIFSVAEQCLSPCSAYGFGQNLSVQRTQLVGQRLLVMHTRDLFSLGSWAHQLEIAGDQHQQGERGSPWVEITGQLLGTPKFSHGINSLGNTLQGPGAHQAGKGSSHDDLAGSLNWEDKLQFRLPTATKPNSWDRFWLRRKKVYSGVNNLRKWQAHAHQNHLNISLQAGVL